MTRLHVVRKALRSGPRYYVYAWRGGPCIHTQDGTKPTITNDMIVTAEAKRREGGGYKVDTLDTIISGYRASPGFAALAASTRRDYKLWLDRLSDKFGQAPIEAFEDRRMRREIILWRDQWADKPRTADKATVMSSTVLGWAVENGLLSINVAAKIRHLHDVNKAEEIWETRHWQALAEAPTHLLDALRLAHLTGLRLSDLVALTWDHVSHQAIVMVTAKRKGRVVIPVLPELRELLDSREWRTGTILQNSRGKAWTASGLGTVFQKSKPDSFDRTIHDLRGTYVTWLAVKGLTDEQIARIVGWTAKKVATIRARYVDEARVVVSMVERLTA